MQSKTSSDLAEMITRVVVQTRAAMLRRESRHQAKHMAAAVEALQTTHSAAETDLLRRIADAPQCPPWLKSITTTAIASHTKTGG